MKSKKSCRNCKFYTHSYGFRNGVFVGGYISCDFNKDFVKQCKQNNFNKWEER